MRTPGYNTTREPIANRHAVADHGVGANSAARTDHCLRAYDGARVNPGALAKFNTVSDAR
jgi:hypothetical protein